MFIASRHKRHCESRENKLTTNIRKHTNSRRTFAAGVFVSTRAPVPGYAHQNSKTGNSIHNIINCGFPCIIYFCPEIPICKSTDRRRFLKAAGLLAGGSMISGTQAINILKHQNKKNENNRIDRKSAQKRQHKSLGIAIYQRSRRSRTQSVPI